MAATFYRDEYVVVLDRLAREYLVREDDLKDVFGLPDKQVRRILADLVDDRLVCTEEVTERLRAKRDMRLDVENQLADLIAAANDPNQAAKKRKRRRGATDIDFDSSSSDDSDASSSSEEEDAHVPGGGWRGGRGGRGGFGRGAPGKKRRSKVKTTCYYINPRYFTDVVKYRLHLMRKHLEGLQRMREGSEAAYRCSNPRCFFECTMIEAEQRRQFVAAARRKAGAGATGGVAGTGIGSVLNSIVAGGRATGASSSSSTAAAAVTASAAASSLASEYEYTCPLCGSTLTARQMENVAAAASRLLTKFTDQLRSTGIPQLIKTLDTVPLGANRPSDTIKAGLITLHGPQAAASAAAAAASAAAADASVAGSRAGLYQMPEAKQRPATTAAGVGGGRVYVKQQQNVEIIMEDEGGGHDGGGSGGGAPGSQSATAAGAGKTAAGKAFPTHDASVAVASLPSFLTKSVLTGEATRTFGFVQIAAHQQVGGGGMGHAASGDGSHPGAAAGSEGILLHLDGDENGHADVALEIELPASDAAASASGADATLASIQSIAGIDRLRSSAVGRADAGDDAGDGLATVRVFDADLNADIRHDRQQDESVSAAAAGCGGAVDGMTDADIWAALWAGLAAGGQGAPGSSSESDYHAPSADGAGAVTDGLEAAAPTPVGYEFASDAAATPATFVTGAAAVGDSMRAAAAAASEASGNEVDGSAAPDAADEWEDV